MKWFADVIRWWRGPTTEEMELRSKRNEAWLLTGHKYEFLDEMPKKLDRELTADEKESIQAASSYSELDKVREKLLLLASVADTSVNLLSCPFCGGEDVVVCKRDLDPDLVCVWCRSCCCVEVGCGTAVAQHAIDAWNKRVNK